MKSAGPRDPGTVLQALEPIERSIVELLAVFHDDDTVSTIARALGKVGQRIGSRGPRNDDTLPHLRSLKERGLVTGEQSFAVPEGLTHPILRRLAQEDRLERMAVVVRELRPARKGPDQRISTWAVGVRELCIELHSCRWDAARALARELPRHIFHDVCRPLD